MSPGADWLGWELPFGLGRFRRVPDTFNAKRRQLLFAVGSKVFAPVTLLIGLGTSVTVGLGFGIVWLLIGLVLLASLPFTLRGHATPVLVIFIAACLAGSLYAVLSEPANPTSLVGLVVVVTVTGATENLRTTVVVASLSTAVAIVPLLLDDSGRVLPVGSNLPSRVALLFTVSAVALLVSHFSQRMLGDAQQRAARNERTARQLQASREGLEAEVEERTSALARRNRELESVNAQLDESIQGELALAAELRRLGETDDLTGLLNRRGFLHRLDALLPLGGWLALADLDHFKRINDTFGHLVGDQVLHRVARTMQQHAPRDWLVGRIGGEEFAILLPDPHDGSAPPDGAAARATLESVLRTVRLLEWKALGLDVPADWRVTTSIGAARFDPAPRQTRAVSGSDLLRRADGALFAAKAAGRDRVAISTEPAGRPR